MKLPRLSYILGVVMTGCSAWWIWGVIIEPFTSGRVTKDEGLAFALLMVPMMVVPGALAGFFGYQLTRSNEPRNVKRVLGCFAVFAAVTISSSLEELVHWPQADRFKDACLMLLATLAVIPIYLKSVAWLLRREGFAVEKVTSLIGRALVFVVALEIHNFVHAAVEDFAPLKPGFKSVHTTPWDLVGVLGSIVVAWAFYRVAVWRLGLPSPPEPQHRTFRLS